MSTELFDHQSESRELAEVQATPMQILQTAVKEGAAADALEKIANLIERRERWDAEREFNAAMCACQSELQPVAKTAHNKQTGSFYAKLEEIGKEIDPIIHAHGFSQSFGTDDCPSPGWVRIVCDLRHSAGHCQRYKVDLPPDDKGIKGTANKTLVHGVASTLTYGERYLTCLMFKVRLEGQDNDGNGADQKITEAQRKELEHLLMESNSDFPAFCEIYGAEKLEDIPAVSYHAAKAQVLKKIQRMRSDGNS